MPQKYSVSGLENGIVNAQRNIAVLKQAIAEERKQIKDFEKKIRDIKWAEERRKEIDEHVARVVIEVEE